MKVLQINSVSGFGSTGRIVTDLDTTLRAKGIESYIAYGREALAENDHTLRVGRKLDYIVHGGLTRLFDRHGLWGSGRATRKLIRRIREIDPDVIHLHNLHGYYLNVRVLFEYLREARKPVIWTLHDCWSFTGHCAHFSYAQCERWREGCHTCPQKRTYPASNLLDNSRRNYEKKKELFTGLENTVIVTPSQWLADLVAKSFLAKYPIKVINNGIDTEVFKPVDGEPARRKYGLGKSFVILGVASTWSERKGFSSFIELSKRIDDTCKIVLVGLSEKQMAKLPANVIGIRRTSDVNELAEVYSAADVFVNASVEETFGLVTAEALACGTPAIVFDSTPGTEIVMEGCGYVVRPDNIQGLVGCIEKVRAKGKSHYSESCRQRVEVNFRKSERFDAYVEVYRNLDEKERVRGLGT